MSTSLTRLQSFYSEFKTSLLLSTMIKREFPSSIALLTSFGPDATILLPMIAEIDAATPILFLNTGNHLPQTLDYVRELSTHLQLNNVHWLTGGTNATAWKTAIDRELDNRGLLALITGRMQTKLPTIELDENGIFRINPLARWTPEKEKARNDLPAHPFAATFVTPEYIDPCLLALGAADTTLPSMDTSNWSV